MGFGVLFAGYFLILDIAYFLLTDVIAAAMIALGLSKLAYLNRGFKTSFVFSLVFLVFALVEFAFGAYEMLFSHSFSTELISYGAIARYVLLCVLSFTAFDGMYEVSQEVKLNQTAKKSKIATYLALPVFVFAVIAETPAFFVQISPHTAAIISVISMLSTIAYIIFGLSVIYECYAKICMPDEDTAKHNSSKKKQESFAEAYRRQREDRKEARAQIKKNK